MLDSRLYHLFCILECGEYITFSLSTICQYNESCGKGNIVGGVANIYLTDILGFGGVSGVHRNGDLSVISNSVS